MPAEADRHDACWMAWPVRRDLWGERLSEVKQDYAAVAQAIARFEPVVMVVDIDHAEEARRACGETIQTWCCSIDDSWMRDSGPTFLRGDRGSLAVADWSFNAWGRKYKPFRSDAALKRQIADQLCLPLMHSRLFAEGGAVLSDGDGTILTTESCLLKRNAGLERDEIESELLACLGAQKIVWLPGDATEIETDGHVDCIASIVAPGRVMMESPSTASAERRIILEANRSALAMQTDARGRAFEIVDIPSAPCLDLGDARHQPTYINFYIANDAVIMPGHGIALDEEARAAVAAAFPDRSVVQLTLKALPYGGGGIHCITQNQPSPKLFRASNIS